ncbi:MAG TPA: D-alanine--D-alanine ligase family protein [Solirubrobacteraceae bacterium]|jgi:D-alanine-D-alanine ligase|nr:D-alanine--D-alanine ligase family protein [Solirubrobacteraceae bacterium]
MTAEAEPDPERLTVAVLAGGRSSEHDVSLSSGEAVRAGLLAAGHDVIPVEIGRDGAWRSGGERLSVTPAAGLLGADVAFPVLHGPFGEDGTVQGLLETLEVPFVGAGVAASAVCLDKVLFKQLMSANGIPQVEHLGVLENRWSRAREKVLSDAAELGLPAFVKPAHQGSSVGIVKVSSGGAMATALDGAFAHDRLAIVEAAAGGIEVECSVLGSLRSEREAGAREAIASQPGQIVLAGDWYDFEAKYSPGGMELRVPAPISSDAAERVRELALEAFALSGCEGLARVDFFIDGDEVLVNELNTMPGFTPTSVYAKLLEASGIGYAEVVDRLCRLALERHAAQRAYLY